MSKEYNCPKCNNPLKIWLSVTVVFPSYIDSKAKLNKIEPCEKCGYQATPKELDLENNIPIVMVDDNAENDKAQAYYKHYEKKFDEEMHKL